MNNKHILLIDDEETTCKAVSRVLTIEDFNVTCLKDGKEGLEYILKNIGKKSQVDILVTDIQMPNMNGIELIAKLNENNIDIPIVIITAHYEKALLNNFKNKDKIIYLEKPFGSLDLLKILTRISG